MRPRRQKSERLNELVQRADNIAVSFDNPYVEKFFDDYEGELVDRIARTTIGETERRNDLIAKLCAMREFREFIERSMAAGRSAREELRELDNG